MNSTDKNIQHKTNQQPKQTKGINWIKIAWLSGLFLISLIIWGFSNFSDDITYSLNNPPEVAYSFAGKSAYTSASADGRQARVNYNQREKGMGLEVGKLSMDASKMEAEERMIKKTATLNLNVHEDQLAEEKSRIDNLVKTHGGFLLNSMLTPQSYASIEARVPATSLDVFLQEVVQLQGKGKVTYQSIEEIDVTDEFVDVSARVKNSESVHATYLKLLEKAHSVSDILAIQRELDRITENMEINKARKERLSKDVQMAVVRITIAKLIETVPPRHDTLSLEFFVKSFKRSFESLQSLLMQLTASAIFLIVYSPNFIITLGSLYYIIKKFSIVQRMTDFITEFPSSNQV